MSSSHGHPTRDPRGKDLWKLTLGALGVVYGDIGTSPLYALKESFHPSHGLPLNESTIFGVLSLVFWALTLVVALKYLTFILRADNQGEGGITALIALLLQRLTTPNDRRIRFMVVILGLFGAGLLYGEGVITPAISVLSAVEGLEIATPAFKPFVIPITLAIITGLFLMQSRGTARIGAIFGPTMVVWFSTLIATGLPWIFRHPEILLAANPMHALGFLMHHGWYGFLVLSSVVLCITGAEALYADMGHFGKRPIRLSWYFLVFPALLINYFGQGALVLDGPGQIENTFYGLVSGWMRYPLVAIATAAAIIASQALISGAFSLTQQIMQLGYLPRMNIQHTSREAEGQIYIPTLNRMMLVSTLILVLIFQESTNLAAAYGIAVTCTMVITSTLFFLVATRVWNWSRGLTGALVALFLVIDVTFFSANVIKLFSGGWIPVMIAISVLAIMTTWKRGREILKQEMIGNAQPIASFLSQINSEKPFRVPGTAVFMTLTQDIAPSVLLHHYRHNQILHDRVLLLSIVTEHEPEIRRAERLQIRELPQGFVKVIARYGYMETPDIHEILERCEARGIPIQGKPISYYLGRETFLTSREPVMMRWRAKLFIVLSKNARSASEFFNLPPDRVIEIGAQVRI